MRMSIILLAMCSQNNKNIKNISFPSCKNCIHYKPFSNNYDLGKCSVFGEKNIISDEISNNYADKCRNDENKCGIEGKYFKEANLETKICRGFSKSIQDNAVYITFTFIFLFQLLCIIIKKG